MNPPFGVDWKKDKAFIDKEINELGEDGRFVAGTPRTSDGSLLFLQHMLSKRMHDEKGSRMAIIFNGSPLFTGDAGSGESNIRKWIIENDMLEGIIAMPAGKIVLRFLPPAVITYEQLDRVAEVLNKILK